jgi:probable modification methyltransferase
MLVTNNLHKIRFSEGSDGLLVTAAFLNTYTLAISELTGRGYSSGLLELTPEAIRQLRIPLRLAERLDFQKIDDWQRKGEVDKILEHTDSVLLREGLGLTDDEINMLHNIWDKLRNKRLNRNKK